MRQEIFLPASGAGFSQRLSLDLATPSSKPECKYSRENQLPRIPVRVDHSLAILMSVGYSRISSFLWKLRLIDGRAIFGSRFYCDLHL